MSIRTFQSCRCWWHPLNLSLFLVPMPILFCFVALFSWNTDISSPLFLASVLPSVVHSCRLHEIRVWVSRIRLSVILPSFALEFWSFHQAPITSPPELISRIQSSRNKRYYTLITFYRRIIIFRLLPRLIWCNLVELILGASDSAAQLYYFLIHLIFIPLERFLMHFFLL